MRFAYADPPYLGCCARYGHRHEAPFGCWDDPFTHWALVRRLQDEYPDGWAISMSSPSIPVYAAVGSAGRWGAWVKPFASFKPGVNPAYAWEPVLFMGGRKRDRTEPTVRDWHSESITLRRGLTGAKPPHFGQWVAELLGATADDTIDDLFPGTGSVGASWAQLALSSSGEPPLRNETCLTMPTGTTQEERKK